MSDRRSGIDAVGRQLGLTSRYAVEGLATLPEAVGDAANAGINAATGVVNTKYGTHIPKLKPVSKGIEDLLDEAGAPKPETPTERIVGDTARAVASVPSFVLPASVASLKIVKPIVDSAAKQAQIAGGGAAGTSVARERGRGPGTQGMLGLSGSVIADEGALALNKLAPAMRAEGGAVDDDDLIPDGGSPDDALIPDDHPAQTAWSSPGAEHFLAEHTPHKDPVLDDRQHAASIPGIARASLAPKTSTQLKRYAHMFKQPESDFMERNGHILRRVPETGETARVEPSVFGGEDTVGGRLNRIGKWMASGVGPSIPRALGTAGAGATAVATAGASPAVAIPAAMGAGAASQGFGEYLRQKGDQFLADDGTPTDWGNVGWHAAEGMAIAPVGKGVEALGRLAARVPGFFKKAPAGAAVPREVAENSGASDNPLMLPKESIDAIKEQLEGAWDYMRGIAADAKDIGLNLSLGQITRNPEIQAMERTAATWPGGASRFGQRRMEQNNEKVPAAFRNQLDEIAPAGAAQEERIGNFRTAADDVVKAEQKKQSGAATKAYAEALDDPQNTLPFTDDLQALFKRPMMKQAWERAQEMAANRGQTLPKFVDFNAAGDPVFSKEIQPNWRSIDWIKRGLDDIKGSNLNSYGQPTGKGADAAVNKRDLLNIVDPINPKYKAARGQYGESADAIDQMLEGGVGLIQRMSGPDRENMLSRVFSGDNLMATDMTKTRALFKAAGKEKEWDAGVRGYLQKSLGDAMERLNSGERGNVAGKLLGVWNSPDQQAALSAAIGDPGKVARFSRLMDIMDHAAHMLPEGSPTGINREISKTTSNNLMSKAKTAISAVTAPWHTAADTVDSYLQRVKEPEARKKIIDFLLTPDGDQRLKAFLNATPDPKKVKLPPAGQQKMLAGLTALLGSAGIEAGRGVRGATKDDEK